MEWITIFSVVATAISVLVAVASAIAAIKSSHHAKKANETAEKGNRIANEAKEKSDETNQIARASLKLAKNSERPAFNIKLQNIKLQKVSFPGNTPYDCWFDDFNEIYNYATMDCIFHVKNISKNDAYYFGFLNPILEQNNVEIEAGKEETVNINIKFSKLKNSENSYPSREGGKECSFEQEIHWENNQKTRFSGIVKFKIKIQKIKDNLWSISLINHGKCDVEMFD